MTLFDEMGLATHLGWAAGSGIGSSIGKRIGRLFGRRGKRIGKNLGGVIGGYYGGAAGEILGSFKKGGRVKRTGHYLLHKGELVVPVRKRKKH